MTYAADIPVLVDRRVIVEEGIGRIGPFDHCLAGRPCHLVARGMD